MTRSASKSDRGDVAISMDISRRFSVLRFPLIVGVVFLHAYGVGAAFAKGSLGPSHVDPIVLLVQDYLSHVIATISVPLFYYISGFLFFVKFEGTLQEYASKLASRVQTLLIPYFFWNILTVAFLALAQANQHTAHYFSGAFAPISSFSPYDYLNALLGLTRAPVSYQFWFIRDLMVLVLLSPLFYFLMRYLCWPAILLLTCVWLFTLSPLRVPSAEATLFFFLGGAVARSGWDGWCLKPGNMLGRWLFLLYMAISILDLITRNAGPNIYIHKVGMLTGIVSVIWLAGFPARTYADGQTDGKLRSRLAKRSARLMETLSPVAFFVFAAHEPLLTVIKKISFFYIPLDSLAVLAIYFTAPVLVIFICVLLYFAVKRIAPAFVSVISGRR